MKQSILDLLVSRSSLFNDVAARPGRDPGTGPACRRWSLFENQNSNQPRRLSSIRFLFLFDSTRLFFDTDCLMLVAVCIQSTNCRQFWTHQATLSNIFKQVRSRHFVCFKKHFEFQNYRLATIKIRCFKRNFDGVSCSWFASRLSASPRSILTIFMFLDSIRLTPRSPPVLADLCNKSFLRAGAQSNFKHHVIVN